MEKSRNADTLFSHFDLSKFSERELYCAYVSYAPKEYVFPLSKPVRVEDREISRISITLTPKETVHIREWFFDRGRKYMREIPYSFREKYADVYDMLYGELAKAVCPSEDYRGIDPSLPECPWPHLCWPEELLKEMKIEISENGKEETDN